MLTLAGYSHLETIHTGINTTVYRGTVVGGSSVILKILNSDYPTLEAIARLKHEYSIAANLTHDSIVKILKLETHDKRLAIVFSDDAGISLKQHLEGSKLSLQQTLEIAVAITEALIYIHSNQVIHKDIKAANIIINPHGKIKLTDFSIASKLSKETIQQLNPNQLEGTLAYMSPEQTGRMNRTVDYRSDFYSMGVTLYEMLTGQLPFISNDPLELVHAHIAKLAGSIQQISSEVPDAVTEIIAKLMAKNAEDRYQSGKGLLADLQLCQKLDVEGKIDGFTAGALDVRSQLLIPQKLYGREEQVTSLLNAFNRVALGKPSTEGEKREPKSELMLVSGYSGIGKTSVINEVNKPITKAKGYFISGKFDQFKRDIPYASLVEAFSGLMSQLLTETASQLLAWKAKIQAAVGVNGQVIIDVIPEVELIIGKQPEVTQLGATEAQNRFHRVFQKFLQIFCQKEHPLVIFLDDLQWADSATLKLMELLITDSEIQYLLLIGAYRDNEVSPSHVLMQTIEEIEKAGTPVSRLILEPLSLNNVLSLITDTLADDGDNTFSLAELICNKTGGNPFFITQLLQALYQEFLLTFDFSQQKWLWNIEEIQAVGITEKSVVELVASRIKKLPQNTQDILKLAACIGDKFTLDVLSIVNKESINKTATELYAALQAGLILPLNEAYKIPLVVDDSLVATWQDNRKSKVFTVSYKFLHDRVQQAAYSLIPESQKTATHLEIGRTLHESIPREALTENILDIVNQLNYGVDLLTQEEEKYELANLNLIAGKKAKNNTAFTSAAKYLNLGCKLLAIDSWSFKYDLTLSLYVETAEAEYLVGNFERSKELANLTLEKAQNLLDKVRIYEIQIRSEIAQNQMIAAMDIGVSFLNLLGVKLPQKPTIVSVLIAAVQTKFTLRFKQVEDLANLPEMTDPYKLAAMQILTLIDSAAAQAGSLYFPLIIMAIVRLSVKYGNSIHSISGYCLYGAILCNKFGDIETGYRFGQLGMKLLANISNSFYYIRIYFLFNALILHFKEPISPATKLMQEGIQKGIQAGEKEFTSYLTSTLSHTLFLGGTNLDVVESKLNINSQIVDKLQIKYVFFSINIMHQATLNLLGNTSEKCKLIGSAFNEEVMLTQLGDNSTALSVFYFFKSFINYLFENYQDAIQAATIVKEYEESNPGLLFYSVNHFYHSLALLANYRNIPLKERKQYLQTVANNQKKMKLFAYHAPCNYQHKFDLVEAEKARISAKNILAADLYDKAIAGAKANNYTPEVAIANELAAKFYWELGKTTIAKTYMTEAYYGYITWCAYAKARDLEERYPNLIIRIKTTTPKLLDTTNTISITSSKTQSSTTDSSSILDLASVMKSSEAIQSNIIIESLPRTLLHIILENAGAQKGSIILETDGNFFIEATNTSEKDFLKSIPVESSQDIPQKIINYVARTQQTVVIRDAKLDPICNQDPYIQTHQCKSILCLPIIYQAKCIGIFYLENNIATGAFTSKRLELLKILVSQAAMPLATTLWYRTP